MNALEIKQFRKQKKMTQASLADWLGVKTRTVIAWENEQNPVPEWAAKKIRSDVPTLNPRLSLDEFQRLVEKADERGKTVEEYIADLIKASLKLLLFFAFCASLFRWAESGDPATGAMMGVADAATFAFQAAWFIGSAGVEVLAAFVRS